MKRKVKIFCFVIAVFLILSTMSYTALAADVEKTDILEESGLYENEYILITDETMTIDEMNAILEEQAINADEHINHDHENVEYSTRGQCPNGAHPGYTASSYFNLGTRYTKNKNDYCWYETGWYTQTCTAPGCGYYFLMYGDTGKTGLHSMVTLTNPNGQVIGYICSNSNCLIQLI
ncbi:MAG: hypothetical protein FWC41_13400 [Firmicutes bacterium]|nr:hypothetical protein [Bacillota bacterium]